MKARIYIVTAVDYGETCNGKAIVVGTYSSREEAMSFVREDIQLWADQRAGENIEVDFDRMSASYYDHSAGCEWEISEADIDFPADSENICCICGCKITGYGNNPYPVKHEGRCCNKCNDNVVVPERMRLASISMKKDF